MHSQVLYVLFEFHWPFEARCNESSLELYQTYKWLSSCSEEERIVHIPLRSLFQELYCIDQHSEYTTFLARYSTTSVLLPIPCLMNFDD
ncbi:hypothetical protein AR158_c794L [Paramecium bursaria Chlorella virus AR158]|uniref:hypothetical protein n=1 Tax=Paramecium bursaria Chlorella virus AR158 TaxID=380598 RepID=UPI00015AA905|nr:hypothetical protein AR158_c794L [Paramecium bursaria Chlorella virus AR158]ABU44339.1 hypothetical protein AR158_c794L [Paramecium bursaria Chlorella virus AR158]